MRTTAVANLVCGRGNIKSAWCWYFLCLHDIFMPNKANFMITGQHLIDRYELLPHPEGGYFKETYRSSGVIPVAALPDSFGGDRPFSTAIYFLLERGNFSAFHRIQSDEGWHFYAGQALLVYVLHRDGRLDTVLLGSDVDQGEVFQYVVPAGCWFASEPAPQTAFAFVGCTVSPGFDYAEFDMAEVGSLAEAYPQHRTIIERLCR